jgi:AcrR family transcriptional regulator
MTTAPDRHARRRKATRAKLVEAAKSLFARQGVDNTRIQEITDEADVGFGSFYNHFQSKEALIEVVLADTVAAQGAEIDALTAQLDDPAGIISAAHRSFVRRARDDPDWAGCSCGSTYPTTSYSPPSAPTLVATSVPASGLGASACHTKRSLCTPRGARSSP